MEEVDPLHIFTTGGRYRRSSFTPNCRLTKRTAINILPHIVPYTGTHPLNSASTCKQHHVHVCQPQEATSEIEAEVLNCVEEEKLALKKIDRELFRSTYKNDFSFRKLPLRDDEDNNHNPATCLFTSTGESYQAPKLTPCLRNTTTRFGYTGCYVKAANGVVPATESDRFRDPEYTTPCYTSQFNDPSKR